MKSVERIESMEKILDEALIKIDSLKKAIDDFLNYQPEIEKLEKYYSSDEWKKDFELDEAGKLPSDLKRGVLSEDSIYNMLESNKELNEILRRTNKRKGSGV